MSRPSIEMNLPPSLLNFYQKQQEYAGLQALREASADLVARAEKLAEMSNIMADGGEAIGGVLRNWPHVFSILSLFTAQMEKSPGDRSRQEDEDEEPLPCLVRLAYGGETASVEGSAPTTTTASDKTKQQ
ncbi:DASH complex subunit DAD2 [Cryptococcus neoformans Tu401-1]|nr:DASH complex subunit DAD2 [Cryptococcus neoformans var. grubii Bt1]OXG24790.1 DASH complex subunit DAD2 [Cryptococcus neoformans var. grubii Tu401-1]OXM82214.1 DASH complex subunit DAD2 [Cryptococcus neoformans var. grubii Bt63]